MNRYWHCAPRNSSHGLDSWRSGIDADLTAPVIAAIGAVEFLAANTFADGTIVTPSGWDSGMICHDSRLDCAGGNFLLYNGNACGKDGFGAARIG